VSQADTRRVLVNLVERPGPDARIGVRLEWRDSGVRSGARVATASHRSSSQPSKEGHHGRNAETVALLVLSDRV
jgi:hypothetical protein